MAGGFGGMSGDMMAYSYLGMPRYKGKLSKSWFVKSPLTLKFKKHQKTSKIVSNRKTKKNRSK